MQRPASMRGEMPSRFSPKRLRHDSGTTFPTRLFRGRRNGRETDTLLPAQLAPRAGVGMAAVGATASIQVWPPKSALPPIRDTLWRHAEGSNRIDSGLGAGTRSQILPTSGSNLTLGARV